MEKTSQPTTGESGQTQPQPQTATPSQAVAAPNGAQSGPPPFLQQAGVVVAPPQQVGHPTWSTGLFECFDDPATFIITFFAPCITYGQIAEMVNRGNSRVWLYALFYTLIAYSTGLGCLLSAITRVKMSYVYRLPDDLLINFLVHIICEPCALCQEYRELQNHGYNMQLGVGWYRQTPEIQQIGAPMTAPNVPGGMTRN